MQLKPGARLRSVTDTTELIVVRAPGVAVGLRCNGQLLEVAEGPMPERDEIQGSTENSVEMGKRYIDQVSGLEVLCTRKGPGPLECDGRELAVKSVKPLPASD